jgi:PPM family protein phosphatase
VCEVFTFSEAGSHPVNEDALAVLAHPARADCWLCALADGQGGQPGGGRAARLACQVVSESAAKLTPADVADEGAWLVLLNSADRAVSADPDAGYTTLLGFCVVDGKVFGASSGDSAVLLLNGDGAAHALTAGQRKNPPVGSGAAVVVPFTARLLEPWAVLGMSDGVWKYVGWERLVQISRGQRGQELLEHLQKAARLRGSGRFQDDFTAVLIQSAG